MGEMYDDLMQKPQEELIKMLDENIKNGERRIFIGVAGCGKSKILEAVLEQLQTSVQDITGEPVQIVYFTDGEQPIDKERLLLTAGPSPFNQAFLDFVNNAKFEDHKLSQDHYLMREFMPKKEKKGWQKEVAPSARVSKRDMFRRGIIK